MMTFLNALPGILPVVAIAGVVAAILRRAA